MQLPFLRRNAVIGQSVITTSLVAPSIPRMTGEGMLPCEHQRLTETYSHTVKYLFLHFVLIYIPVSDQANWQSG